MLWWGGGGEGRGEGEEGGEGGGGGGEGREGGGGGGGGAKLEVWRLGPPQADTQISAMAEVHCEGKRPQIWFQVSGYMMALEGNIRVPPVRTHLPRC